MKIEQIDLPREITMQAGLQKIEMKRLGDVVLISGKNGSGKTRFLNLLSNLIAIYPTSAEILNQKAIVKSYQDQITGFETNIYNTQKQLDLEDMNEESRTYFLDQIDQQKQQIEYSFKNMDDAQQELSKMDRIKFIPSKEQDHVIKFVPKSLILTDGYSVSPSELHGQAQLIYIQGTNQIAQGAIPAIEFIIKQWVNANVKSDGDLGISDEEIKKINADYERLREYIRLFLNTELKRGADGHGQLFNQRIGIANLSDGQKILLQFCMALYAQEASLDNLLIMMDEPENHLHPAALIEVLDKITSHVKNGQVWIATHSINILAHYDPSCIWFIDEGLITYAGDIPNKVLTGLLGPEDEIEKVASFLSLPAEMAINKFAFESLFYPKVVVTGSKDPQVNQIHQIINQRKNDNNLLKVLDFGIGKGRFISTIAENERTAGSSITEWLDYYGYDKFTEHRDLCVTVLSDVYGNGVERYHSNEEECFSKHDKGSFDYIIMCNVLHEIDPAEWLDLFTSPRSVFHLLKEEGFLLVVEDQYLAVGEKAHPKGFLVFDQMEFMELFDIKTKDGYLIQDYRGDGKLKAHHIPAKCISRITKETRSKSIKMLLASAKNEIKGLRQSGDVSFKSGKRHGFWAQQLTNTSLVLDELGD